MNKMGQSNVFDRAMFADETTFGTAVTRNEVLSRLQSGSITENNNLVQEYGVGEGMNAVKTYLGNYNCDFSMNINVNSFDFLRFWVGPLTGSGTSGVPYALTEATVGLIGESNSLDSFSLEAVNTTDPSNIDGKLLAGCVGNDFSMSGSLNGPLTASLSGFAQKPVDIVSATSYTPSTLSTFMVVGGVFKIGSVPTTLPGVRSFSFNYTNGMNRDDFYGSESRFIEKPVLGTRGYTGSLTVKVTKAVSATINTIFYGQTNTSGPINDGTAETTSDIEFKIELANGVQGANIWFDQASILDITRDVDIGGGLRLMTFNWTAKSAKNNIPFQWWYS